MELLKFNASNLNVERLASLLSSVKKVDNSVTLELNTEEFLVQSALETKSATKFKSLFTNDILETTEEIPKLLFPFLDCRNLENALKLFTPSASNTVTVEYAKLNDSLTVVDNMTINENNGTLIINIKCSDISDVIYLNDTVKSSLLSESDALGEFEIDEMKLKKATNIFNLDSDYTSAVSLESNGSDVFLKGHNYKYKICEFYKGEELDLTFQKKYLDFVEQEFSNIFLHENRIVFKSMDTNTQTVIAVSEEVEEYN